jgi:TM2 domain-containing membrane protein YozV
MSVKSREITIITVLLITTAIFGFVLIPVGIREGFGSDGAGLSPRFMPELATAGIALALIFGLLRHLFIAESNKSTGLESADEDERPLRAVVVVAICLFFSLVGFRVAGFYLGGVAMAFLLMMLLGERKLFNVLGFPILVLLVIYLVFEFGFQIRLPKSGLIPSIPV